MHEAKEKEDKNKYSLRMVILRMVILRMVILRKDESEEDEPAHGYPAHGNPGWIPDNDFGLEVAIAVRPLPLSVDGLPADIPVPGRRHAGCCVGTPPRHARVYALQGHRRLDTRQSGTVLKNGYTWFY